MEETENLLRFSGEGAHDNMRTVARISNDWKLGGLSAASKAWSQFSHTLCSEAPARMRTLIFAATVQSALLTGLPAFC
eukprot:913394-Lingulodinium_polyedra.AAC.1